MKPLGPDTVTPTSVAAGMGAAVAGPPTWVYAVAAALACAVAAVTLALRVSAEHHTQTRERDNDRYLAVTEAEAMRQAAAITDPATRADVYTRIVELRASHLQPAPPPGPNAAPPTGP